ncbi:MAG TPA: ferritin-like protein [Urbifossiella sp.]|nr:ferritin-like protein [Urbifossiella sp.]
MSQRRSIPDLTAELGRAAPGADGEACLRRSARAAIRLEFATVPPYLTAQWSVEDQGHDVANTINEVLRDEMSHMGLACNMLVGLGESPDLATAEFVPTYPGGLPGDVNPGLAVWLKRLTPAQLKTFLDIEYPDGGPITREAVSFDTIGAFYAALSRAFRAVNPCLDATRQRTAGGFHVDVHPLPTVEKVLEAIDVIRLQGEGSRAEPTAGDPEGTLAHFYRFREVYVGAKYIYEAGTWGHSGPVVPMPAVVPMADIPPGGYRQADVSADVWTLLHEFDTTYSLMLRQLTRAWRDPNAPLGDFSGDDPIRTMGLLQQPAQRLMALERPDGRGNYGPCFRLV